MNKMKLRVMLDGVRSLVPFLNESGLKGTVISGDRLPARYFYSVYLRHLVKAHENGLPTRIESLAELGPGDSLGIGISALLTGASVYRAFDIMKFASSDYNLIIFRELVDLFRRREKIPDTTEFPEIKPLLDSCDFPFHILTRERMDDSLSEERIDSIESALRKLSKSDDKKIEISYVAPWYESGLIEEESLDVIISQAVMEHVDGALGSVYGIMNSWLKPGGWISHDIDFRSHGLSDRWNGHWTYSDSEWAIIRGKRPFLLNRAPHSSHLNQMKASGFEVVCDIRNDRRDGYGREYFAPAFKNMSDEDAITSTAFVQARKEIN